MNVQVDDTHCGDLIQQFFMCYKIDRLITQHDVFSLKEAIFESLRRDFCVLPVGEPGRTLIYPFHFSKIQAEHYLATITLADEEYLELQIIDKIGIQHLFND